MAAAVKLKHRQLDSLLVMVRGSVGGHAWQHAYFTVAGKKTDLVVGGKKSCAFFVSSLLKLFNLVDTVHLTVASTITDMERCGWKKIRAPKPGCILVWEPIAQGGSTHSHVGFYVGSNKAVSNDWKKCCPQTHHWTYRGQRRVVAMYQHTTLRRG